MRIFNRYLTIILLLLIFIFFIGCITYKTEVVRTSGIELQLINNETKEPLPNINVRYTFIIERGKYRLFDWYAYDVDTILIKEGEYLSNNDGTVFIEENEINKRKFDSITLRICINIAFDEEKVEAEIKKYGYSPRHDYVDITPGYFLLYNYRDCASFIDENYYPAYIYCIYSSDGSNYEYISLINQINNTGNKNTDFQSIYLHNDALKNFVSQKVIIMINKTQ